MINMFELTHPVLTPGAKAHYISTHVGNIACAFMLLGEYVGVACTLHTSILSSVNLLGILNYTFTSVILDDLYFVCYRLFYVFVCSVLEEVVFWVEAYRRGRRQ